MSKEDFPSLSSKKTPRQRHRGPPPENLLYKDESEITSLNDLQKLLGQEIPTTADQDKPFETQVAISLSEIKLVSLAELKAEKRLQEKKIYELDQQIDNLQVMLIELEKKIKEVQQTLQQLVRKREFEEEKKTEKPLHIALRNLGELILIEAQPTEIIKAFFELPTNVQKILLRVKNLIPQEILQKQVPVPVPVPFPVFQAVAMSTEMQVSGKSETYSFVEQVAFKACAFLKKNPTNPCAMVSLSDTIEIGQALEKLRSTNHDIIKDIYQVSCISDYVNDCVTLSLYDETNSRHTKKPHGVLSMIVLYHINNEETVIDMINTELSLGIWDTDYKKDLHKRLLTNRKMF